MIRLTPKPVLAFMMQNLPEIATQLLDFSLYRKLWSTIVGCDISNGKFLEAGTRIHVLERYMNTLEGVSRKDDVLPQRLMKEGRDCDSKKRVVPLEDMLGKYYKIRGFDSNGIPTAATLRKLGIPEKGAQSRAS